MPQALVERMIPRPMSRLEAGAERGVEFARVPVSRGRGQVECANDFAGIEPRVEGRLAAQSRDVDAVADPALIAWLRGAEFLHHGQGVSGLAAGDGAHHEIFGSPRIVRGRDACFARVREGL